MGGLGCNLDGNLNDTKFSEPMPWIGVYVAAASLACALAMAADAIHGFRQRKFWFPCKYFTINATSLTLIGVAIKLSVDLNTSMPRRQDQLAKLSSAVLICTLMGNSMPSLGIMENKEILMSIMALGILVITLTVNICIQLGTGVIYLYWKEHAVVMFLMLSLLVILSFSALTVPTTKRYLEFKYKHKHELALQESSSETDTSLVKKLKANVMKYWVMAHTSSPQFVMGRSVTCNASGALCLLSAMILAEAMLRSYLMPWFFDFCVGESDYKWSTTLVLVTQTVAVGVGTIAPAFRWLMAVNFKCPTRKQRSYAEEFRLEKYWIQSLVDMKDCPLELRIGSRHCRKLVHDARNMFLNLCIRMQTGIVFISKVIRILSIKSACLILACCCRCCRAFQKKFNANNSISNDSGSESRSSSKSDLSRFVLHLEGENELIHFIMRKNCDATDHWMHRGKKKQPNHLIKLLEMSVLTEEHKGVTEFDSNQVPPLDCEEPPNCWALPVVTLASIAIALPNINQCSIKKLVYAVTEGLIYVKLIEDTLDTEGDLKNIRAAANVVWHRVDLYHKWLDVDLCKLSTNGKDTQGILGELADLAKNRYMEHKETYMKACLKETPSKWPIKVLAANSMYRITKTILLRKEQPSERLFEALVVMISDILGACLTNLQRVIVLKCLRSSIEEREDSVRCAVNVLGRTQNVLKMQEKRELSGLDADQMACIDHWRLHKLKIPSPVSRTSAEDGTASSIDNVYLTID